MRPTSAWSVTSVETNTAASPRRSASAVPCSVSMSAMTTDTPWSTSSPTVAAPMPEAPPVTMAVRPASGAASLTPASSRGARGRRAGDHGGGLLDDDADQAAHVQERLFVGLDHLGVVTLGDEREE